MLTNKHIALGVTGSIAAYKSILLLRELKKLNARVTVILTANALNFVTPLTFKALSGEEVITGTFEPGDVSLRHTALARQIDLLLVAPATANIIGKFAGGIADDFLSTLYLAVTIPTLIAPAMYVEMYKHPATQENIRILSSRGVEFLGPEAGDLACGASGLGRLIDADFIVKRVAERLTKGGALQGKRILICAGPTQEPIDRVRFISNPSSGKMGCALAQEAANRGAQVILISGPTHLNPPRVSQFIRVETAEQMYNAVIQRYDSVDAVIMAAAVGDYTPARPESGKVKKSKRNWMLELMPTIDILAELGKFKQKQILVGFAAEVENVRANAKGKIRAKNLDMIVANDVSKPGAGFGTDTNQVTIIDAQGNAEELPLMPKTQVAQRILDRLQKFWN